MYFQTTTNQVFLPTRHHFQRNSTPTRKRYLHVSVVTQQTDHTLTTRLPQLQIPRCRKRAVTVFPKPAVLSAPWHPSCWRVSRSHPRPRGYQSRTASSCPQYQTVPEHRGYRWCNMHLRGPDTQKQNKPVSCMRRQHHSCFEPLPLSREGKGLKRFWGHHSYILSMRSSSHALKCFWKKKMFILNLISSQRNKGTVLFLVIPVFLIIM